MTLYHRTSRECAESILKEGFRDGTGKYLTEQTHAGVWLSVEPLDAGEGGLYGGDDTRLLAVDIDLSEFELTTYEWVEEGKDYREFLIPASILNSRSRSRIVEEECGPPLPLPPG
jgi:hypothetical protein